MKYNFQKEFFLVRNDDTGTTKLFHRWWSVVDFLTDDIMKYGYHKNREECFNLLFNVENTKDLNDILKDLWHIELIEFSD